MSHFEKIRLMQPKEKLKLLISEPISSMEKQWWEENAKIAREYLKLAQEFGLNETEEMLRLRGTLTNDHIRDRDKFERAVVQYEDLLRKEDEAHKTELIRVATLLALAAFYTGIGKQDAATSQINTALTIAMHIPNAEELRIVERIRELP